jgi:hypothetical protein
MLSSDHLRFVVLLSHEGEPIAYARRIWYPRERHVEHSIFTVSEAYRNGSVGARLLANSLPFYTELGVRTVGLTAGLTAGGAVWPLFGFRPATYKDWEGVKLTIRRNYARLPARVGRSYPGGPLTLGRAISTILKDPHPDGIWSVVDLDPDRKAARAADLPRSLGSWLLGGSRWRGVLDLENPQARKRAENYIINRLTRGVMKSRNR